CARGGVIYSWSLDSW
nr:immunoglobulin heavy chain junction region [Macaca mulatta]